MKTYIILVILTLFQSANAEDSVTANLLDGSKVAANTSVESSIMNDDFTAITSENRTINLAFKQMYPGIAEQMILEIGTDNISIRVPRYNANLDDNDYVVAFAGGPKFYSLSKGLVAYKLSEDKTKLFLKTSEQKIYVASSDVNYSQASLLLENGSIDKTNLLYGDYEDVRGNGEVKLVRLSKEYSFNGVEYLAKINGTKLIISKLTPFKHSQGAEFTDVKIHQLPEDILWFKIDNDGLTVKVKTSNLKEYSATYPYYSLIGLN